MSKNYPVSQVDPDPGVWWAKTRIKFVFFFIKDCNLLISRRRLQEKPAAFKREHPALKKNKFITFFLFLLVMFAFLDPDPYCESGSGSRTPVCWIRIHNTALNWHKHRLSVLQFMNNFTNSLGLNFPAIFIFENVFRFYFFSENLVSKKMMPVTQAVNGTKQRMILYLK